LEDIQSDGPFVPAVMCDCDCEQSFSIIKQHAQLMSWTARQRPICAGNVKLLHVRFGLQRIVLCIAKFIQWKARWTEVWKEDWSITNI